MYYYVALHINDCIANWAVKPSIIHKMLLIGQCPVSKMMNRKVNSNLKHTHTSSETAGSSTWINTQDYSDCTVSIASNGTKCPQTRYDSLWDVILCIHLPVLQRTSQGQTGWMLCLVTSWKSKKHFQSKKGYYHQPGIRGMHCSNWHTVSPRQWIMGEPCRMSTQPGVGI